MRMRTEGRFTIHRISTGTLLEFRSVEIQLQNFVSLNLKVVHVRLRYREMLMFISSSCPSDAYQ